MKIYRILTLLLAVTAIAACATFPKTPGDFKEYSAGVHMFTANVALQEAYELVAAQTAKCHQATFSTLFIGGQSNFILPIGKVTVEGERIANEASIQVKYSDPLTGGLLQLIEFSPAETADKTIVTVYKINNTTKWSTAARNVETWFHGGSACYQIW